MHGDAAPVHTTLPSVLDAPNRDAGAFHGGEFVAGAGFGHAVVIRALVADFGRAPAVWKRMDGMSGTAGLVIKDIASRLPRITVLVTRQLRPLRPRPCVTGLRRVAELGAGS